MIKTACLEFENAPISFNQNKIDRKDILDINEQILIQVQKNLDKNGAYDQFYRKHDGKSLYIKPLLDYVSTMGDIGAW